MNTFFVLDGFSQTVPINLERRLLDFGFTKGQKVRVLQKSILSKVLLIEIRKFVLSLRKEIAQYVLVEGE